MADPRQRNAAFALALLLLAGCSKTSTPRAEQSPPPAATKTTALVVPQSGCARESGEPPVGMVNTDYVRQAICQAVIHTDPTRVTFRLPPDVTEEAARQALTVTGVTGEQVRFNRTRLETVLAVTLPEGEPGDTVTVRLEGPVGAGGVVAEMGFELKRVETPRISTEVQVGNEPFKPLVPGSTLPRQPLQFRFTLVGQPKRDRVEAAIQEALRHKGSQTPYTIAWEGDSRLLLTVPEPPPALFFPFDWLEAEQGLQVQRSAVALYTGEAPPQLVALDPATGQEEVLGEMPVDVLQPSLSPDGAWAALIATAPDAAEREQVWVVNTRTGQRWLTGFESDWAHQTIHWLPGGRLMLPAYRAVQVWDLNLAQGRREESEATYWGPLSPDKRYLAGTAVDPLKVDEATLITPASVVLLETGSLASKLLPDLARTRARQSSAPTYLPMLWQGERLWVADLVDYDKEKNAATTRFRVVEPETGAVLSEEGAPPQAEPPVGWPAATSGWQYKPDPNWGEVHLRSPEGRERAAGQGLVVGWRADGKLLVIRWANFPYLRRTEGI